MGESKPTFKTKMIYGLVAIVPIGVIAVVLIKLIEVINKLAEATGLHTAYGASLAVILAFLLLLLVLYVTGSLIQTKIGAWSFDKLEQKLLLQIPGYRIISNILKGFAEGQIEAYRPAMIQLGQQGFSVLGFVMEENDNETTTVFVPSVPAATIGNLLIVENNCVTLLEASHLDTVTCISEWGIGTNKLIGKRTL